MSTWRAWLLLHVVSCGAKWILAGLGHCKNPRKIWRHLDLAECLRSCEDDGTTCSYVSFLDDALIRDSFSWEAARVTTSLSGAGSLCLHFSTCSSIRSTHSGAATFQREEMDLPQDMEEDDWVTIATGRSMSASSSWQLRKQLCVSPASLVVLEEACSSDDLWAVKLVSDPGDNEDLLGGSFPVSVTISTAVSGLLLCSDGESLSLANASAVPVSSNCIWDLLRARENQQDIDSEPCMWIRRSLPDSTLDGEYLSVASGDGPPGLTFLPWSRDMSASCWNFGYKQTWMHQNFDAREDVEIGQVIENMEGEGSFGTAEQPPHIWLMASPKYFKAMQRLLSRFHRAGDPVRVSVRWVPEFKGTNMRGFDFVGDQQSLRVYAFNYLKLLFLYEAFLDTVQGQASLVVVMDLDVQVRPGWKSTLAKCVEEAEICFLQQAAFGDRWQQANSGVLVWRPVATVGAFLQAVTARLQGHQVLTRLLPSYDVMAFEQLFLNYELHRAAKLAERWKEHPQEAGGNQPRQSGGNGQQGGGQHDGDEHQSVDRHRGVDGHHLGQRGPSASWNPNSNPSTLIWGIYNPLVAYIGMFLTTGILTTTVHHATSSRAQLKEKLRFMDAAEQFSSDIQEWCPVHPSGALEIVGPLLEFCYLFSGVDPHFGPLLEHYRLRKGFSSNDNLGVIDHLQKRSGKTKVWVHSVVNFNDGAHKFYLQKRRNSSWPLADLYLHPPY